MTIKSILLIATMLTISNVVLANDNQDKEFKARELINITNAGDMSALIFKQLSSRIRSSFPPAPDSVITEIEKSLQSDEIEDYAKAIGYKIKISFEPRPAT